MRGQIVQDDADRCPTVRTDGQLPELVESEHPRRHVAADVLDVGEFGVAIGADGFLPGLGPLEGDAVAVQDLSQPFPPDRDGPGRLQVQVLDKLADADFSQFRGQLSTTMPRAPARA